MIRTQSRRLAVAAWVCRWLPPALTGGRLVAPLYPDEVARRENVRFERRSSLADVTFSYDHADYIAVRFAMRGYYEWRNVVIANVVCGRGDTIVEIGANIGTETLLFARIVGPEGRVVAFEPVPDNAETLRRLAAENELDNLEIVEAAVSDRPGRMRFATQHDDYTSGEGRLVEYGDRIGTLEVETVILDEWLGGAGVPAPKLVFSDTEGAELFVLRGMSRLLREQHPVLLLENEPKLLAHHGLTSQDVARHLDEAGYRLYTFTRRGIVPLDTAAADRAVGNWLGLPTASADEVGLRIHRALRRAAWMPPVRGLSPAVIARAD